MQKKQPLKKLTLKKERILSLTESKKIQGGIAVPPVVVIWVTTVLAATVITYVFECKEPSVIHQPE